MSFKLIWNAYSVEKSGNNKEENEDSYYPRENSIVINREKRFGCAIADGATESSFSKNWAELLTSSISRHNLSIKNIIEIFQSAQIEWLLQISKLNLRWNEEIKVREGSNAAFLWLVIEEKNSAISPVITWRIFYVGDCILFHIRNQKIIDWFPHFTSENFNNSPHLISTKILENKYFVASYPSFQNSGKCEFGDSFFLSTDALSKLVIKEIENGINPLMSTPMKILSENHCKDEFIFWIEELRAKKMIKNDDTTLIIINIFD